MVQVSMSPTKARGAAEETAIRLKNEAKLEINTLEKSIKEAEAEIKKLDAEIKGVDGSKYTARLLLTGPGLEFDSGVEEFGAERISAVVDAIRRTALHHLGNVGRARVVAVGTKNAASSRIQRARQRIDTINYRLAERLKKLGGE